MEYKKGLALVASIKPKTGAAEIDGILYDKNVVVKVDKVTADKAVASGNFHVGWLKVKTETEKVIEESAPAEPEPAYTEEEMDFDEVLAEYDALKVAETAEYLLQFDDKEVVEYLAENAQYKGSRANAMARLEDLAE